MKHTIELECTGLRCPLPILRTKEALRTMAVGDVVRVATSDPQSKRDFPALSEQIRCPLLAAEQREGLYVFWLRKEAADADAPQRQGNC